MNSALTAAAQARDKVEFAKKAARIQKLHVEETARHKRNEDCMMLMKVLVALFLFDFMTKELFF